MVLMLVIVVDYIYELHTSIDLKSKLKVIKYTIPDNDIVVEFDATKLTQESFNILNQLPEIIQESGDIGEFELDIFKIKIQKIWEYQNDLIYLEK